MTARTLWLGQVDICGYPVAVVDDSEWRVRAALIREAIKKIYLAPRRRHR